MGMISGAKYLEAEILYSYAVSEHIKLLKSRQQLKDVFYSQENHHHVLSKRSLANK